MTPQLSTVQRKQRGASNINVKSPLFCACNLDQEYQWNLSLLALHNVSLRGEISSYLLQLLQTLNQIIWPLSCSWLLTNFLLLQQHKQENLWYDHRQGQRLSPFSSNILVKSLNFSRSFQGFQRIVLRYILQRFHASMCDFFHCHCFIFKEYLVNVLQVKPPYNDCTNSAAVCYDYIEVLWNRMKCSLLNVTCCAWSHRLSMFKCSCLQFSVVV